MAKILSVVVLLSLCLSTCQKAVAITPTNEEMAQSRAWAAAKFEGVDNAASVAVPASRCDASPCFSFIYDGKPSAELLKTWECKRTSRALDAQRTERVVTYTEPKTGLEIRCEAIEYSDYPAVEWILYFQNHGSQDTPILENVQALDTSLTALQEPKTCMIHHAGGAQNITADFGAIDDSLTPGGRLKIGSQSMSSVNALPYFNMDWAQEGMIVAVGWSGSWSAEFVRNTPQSLTVKAGMDSTHLLLHPGERIRTPRILVMFWQKDLLRSYNLWRRLILAHYAPHPSGKLLKAPLTDGNWGAFSAADQIGKIHWWRDHHLPLDCYWIDAGWSGKTGPIEAWPDNAANRVPNPELYPNGIKEVSDAAHACGMKFLLWTWPHRALPGVEVGAEHPDWLVNNEAIDHGNPAANQWMTEKYSRSIDEYGLDVFRQDGHPVLPPDSGPDRQGINQIRHFEGFYTFWDTLLAQHPDVMIDNCAGGGRKLDLETNQRSISLWRSDFQCNDNFDPAGMQGQTYGLSSFVPLSGGCTTRTDSYSFRSGYSPALCINWHVFVAKNDDKNFNFVQAEKMLNEYLAVRDCFYGDYYPLTPYSLSHEVWMAWQFDRPEQGDGIVQAFRRPKSLYESMRCSLHGLEADAVYTLTNMDVPGVTEMTGRELMEQGLVIELPTKPGSAVIRYQKKP